MSDSVTRREKYAVLPSRVSCGGPMTSRVTAKIFRTCFDRVSTTKNASPPATNSTRRLSGSHTGHWPKSVSRSYFVRPQRIHHDPLSGRIHVTARRSPSGDHEFTRKWTDGGSSGGNTSGVCCFHGRLGSKIQPFHLTGTSWIAPTVAIFEPSGDHARYPAPPSVSCCRSAGRLSPSANILAGL